MSGDRAGVVAGYSDLVTPRPSVEVRMNEDGSVEVLSAPDHAEISLALLTREDLVGLSLVVEIGTPNVTRYRVRSFDEDRLTLRCEREDA